MRSVVSVITGGQDALSSTDPAVAANVYAVAEDVELTVVLRGAGVEFAVDTGPVPPLELAGSRWPGSGGAVDLRGLVESGIVVRASVDDLAAGGLSGDDLIDGVEPIDRGELRELLRSAEAVLRW